MKEPKTLKTERLVLRRVYTTDIDLYEATSDREVVKYECWEPHKDVTQLMQYINSVFDRYEKGECTEWTIETVDTEEAIGMISIHDVNTLHRHGELGFWLSKKHWGKGYAAEAAQIVIKYAFKELGLLRIQSYTSIENTACIRVLEKLGMQREGVLRKYMYINSNNRREPSDIALYSIIQ